MESLTNIENSESVVEETESPTIEDMESTSKLSADFTGLDTESPPVQIDDKGNVFDPESFLSDENGNPQYRINGKTFAKKRGQKKGGSGNPKGNFTKPEITETPEGTSVVAFSPEVISAMGTTGYFQIMRIMLGEDYATPIQQTFVDEDSGKSVTFDEAAMFQQSLKGILIKRGIKGASPEFMLAMVMVMGIGARATNPEGSTRKRLFGRFATVRQKFRAWRTSRKKRKKETKENKEDLTDD